IYLLVRISTFAVRFVFERYLNRHWSTVFDKTAVSLLQRILITIIYIMGGEVFVSMIPALDKLGTSLLAGAGIMTLAVGVASQEAVSNIVSGLFIAFAKPFRIGDFIAIDSTIKGKVVQITLRHTVVNNAENRKVIVPNSKMNTATIINSTVGEPATCSFIEIGVGYDTNLDDAMRIMQEEALAHPLLIDRRSPAEKEKGVPQVVVRVIELGDSAIMLKAWVWAANSGDAFVLKCDLLKSIKERFDREGIEIPYPCRNIIVKES
ncbi:MAG: mechanosensitive ion channel family protein, partial [Bacteroides sp.]|nr:mechanosensitive ion channel family protein [Bacteroides sp.]